MKRVVWALGPCLLKAGALGPSTWAKTRAPDPGFVASLVSYHQEMLAKAVAKLSSGRPFADWIFEVDTTTLPKEVPLSWLQNATKDSASAQSSLQDALRILARGLTRLSSGAALADAVFGVEAALLLQPVAPDNFQPRFTPQQIASLGPKQISVLMARENDMLAAGVGKLSSGKAFADYIFGMDTGELPTKLPSEAYLAHFVQDRGLARFALNATMSMLGHAASQLSSGKPLADAIFGCDVSHLAVPNEIVMTRT
ncbi:der [Symbiodinium pilosum]|uniref:Der protein n=1 Tax=Symbiodinium pilosum TaxID=2952 RepID=A0A812YBN3_SYMPI|nr:der [Symbiodinium pilosum]